MFPLTPSGNTDISKKDMFLHACLPVPAEKTFFSGPGYGMFHPEVICHKEKAMKRFLTLLTVGLVSVLLFASAAPAEEVKNDYFTLNVSDGWTMPEPAQSVNGAVFAIVQYPDGLGAVSVTVTPVPLSAKELAAQTLANMKSGGFTVSEPVASGDSYIGEFSQAQARGVSYFTANGKVGSVITIVGVNIDDGKKFLNKNFKALDARLFPASF